MTPIAGPEVVAAVRPLLDTIGAAPAVAAQNTSMRFADVLSAGMRNVESRIANADDLVRRFTLNQDVPVHQVTYALEEAKLSVDLAMQVRGRLLDGYRELMNMQL